MPDVTSNTITKIYENTNITVKARIDQRDVDSIEEVTFKFLKDGEEFEEKKIPISEGVKGDGQTIVSHVVKSPAVPDDKTFYFLDYHYFYKVKSTNASSESLQNFPSSRIQVFPRVAQLKVTDKDGKAFPNFEFMVEQNAELSPVSKTVARDTPNAKGETIPAGSCEFNLNQFPGFRIVASPPYQILEEVTGTGRKQEIKGGIGFRAIFVAPEKGTVRQYVNYDVENLGQARIGHAVTIEVGIHPDDLPFVKTDDTAEVHFRVTYGPDSAEPVAKSERNDADYPTKVLKASESDTSATIEEKEANKKYEGKVVLVDGAGKFVVALGKAGGDTCTVEISGSDKFLTDENLPPDATLEIENWRLVHYELMVPDTLYKHLLESSSLDLRPDLLQPLETLGNQLFIEFIHGETHIFDTIREADHGTLGPRRFFGLPEDPDTPAYILSGRNWRKLPRAQSWTHEYAPTTLYIFLCDRLLKWRKDTSDESAGTKDFSGTLTEAAGVINPQDRFEGLFMPFSGHDSGDGVAEIVWTADISKDDGVCKYTPELTMEDVRYEASPSGTLVIDLEFDGADEAPTQLVFDPGTDGSYPSDLSEGNSAQIEGFVNRMLTNNMALAKADGKAVVYVSCPDGNDHGEDNCIASAKTKIQEFFDAAKKEFAFHPALDPEKDFSPRTDSCPMSKVTDFKKSTVSAWHFLLPRVLPDGSPGPGSFVGPAKTKEKCPVKFEFSFQPHEVSPGESDGELLAWACSEAEASKHLLRLVLRSFGSNGDEAGLEHGHGEGNPGDCLDEADVLCAKCIAYGRARNLTILT